MARAEPPGGPAEDGDDEILVGAVRERWGQVEAEKKKGFALLESMMRNLGTKA